VGINSNTIHLPDLQFVQFCEERFGLNRGVYNTIDSWFYHKGVIDIVNRRKRILHFLENICHSIQNSKLKFGHGGLSSCLSSYWDKCTKDHLEFSRKNTNINSGS
jgi:riboflavin kinase